MGDVILPFNFVDGDDAEAGQVMANDQAIAATVNGSLEAGTNIRTGVPTVQTSQGGLSEGAAPTIMRSDAQFVIRGVEPLAADPATSNFPGRVYFNTSTLQIRQCTDPTGTGTWITIGNLQAADLPTHGARHASGGADPLPANSIAASMLARSGFVSALPTGDITLTTSAWTDVITGVTVSTQGASGQSCLFVMNINWSAGANAGNLNFRLQDPTPATVWRSGANGFAASGGTSGNDQEARTFTAAVNVTGTKVYKLQAFTGVAGVQIKATMTAGTETGPSTRMDVLVG